jgi:N-acetylneuraminate synthase|tara:strand:- start:250 stop:1083 length:834 start_codon:yes stop_codon:yes gene_type:complete
MHTYVIAEVGINHNGDIELAKELIHKAFIAGCDAVKFQKRDIESVYTQEELDTPRESPFGTTTREQKEGIEFNIEQYKELQAYAEELSLDFIVSCWDQMSLFQVEKHLDVKYHKVASAMATDKEFLEKLNETNKPVILSVGMCTDEEVEAAMNILDNVEYVLACTSTYPTAPEEVNLRYLETLKRLYPNTKVGFSNHYNGMDACVGSVALGAECVEFHITKQRAMYGSDQAASIQDVDDLCDAIRKMEVMLGDGIKVVYDTEKPIAQKLRKVNNTVE